MPDDVSKASLHHAKDRQHELGAAFWQRTLDAGRQAQQTGKQMQEAEREAEKPKLRPRL